MDRTEFRRMMNPRPEPAEQLIKDIQTYCHMPGRDPETLVLLGRVIAEIEHLRLQIAESRDASTSIMEAIVSSMERTKKPPMDSH